MFTGIIEEIGVVKELSQYSTGAKLFITCNKVLEDVNIGDSIAIDGVCQTVVTFANGIFSVNVSEQTLNVTNFKYLKPGKMVNLERALSLNTRLGGHIVTGHVDNVGIIKQISDNGEFFKFRIEIPDELVKYVVQKGSVTINGISLTVAEIVNNVITIAIIPHTFKNTNLKNLRIGDFVNIETDILAKYIEKMLLSNGKDKGENNISMEFLVENGYV